MVKRDVDSLRVRLWEVVLMLPAVLAMFLSLVIPLVVLPILLIWIIVWAGLIPHALILGGICAVLYWKWGRRKASPIVIA